MFSAQFDSAGDPMSIDKVVFGSNFTAAANAVAVRSEPTRAPASVAPQDPVSPPAPPQPADPERVAAAVKQIESYLQSVNRSLEFRIDADSGKTVVSIRDAKTGDLIRQIPNEDVLRLAELAKVGSSVLLSETV